MWTIVESILFGTVYTYINKSMGMYIVIHIKNKKKTQMQFKDETGLLQFMFIWLAKHQFIM